MRVLVLTWEYPPVSVGGLARHVRYLVAELARRGHLVDVVTQGGHGAPDSEESRVGDGVLRVTRRTAYALSPLDFLHWVHQLNYGLIEAVMGLAMAGDGGASPAASPPFDIVHAHDWLVAFAARAAKHAYRVPLVATIHATEAGRHHGIHNPWQRYISEIEWWLTYEAWRVICCSGYMESELSGQFQLPGDKIRVIPNGIDPGDVDAGASGDPHGSGDSGGSSDSRGSGGAGDSGRGVYAQPGEDIIFFVGRLVREKGVDTLLDALPAILDRRPSLRLVIAGTGPNESHLRQRVSDMGLSGRVHFAGHLDDRRRNLLYKWASVAVVPSYYEPFGLTALEAMAAGAPVVVSDTGGLAETVVHEETGLKIPPANPGELAAAVLRLLADRDLAFGLAQEAKAQVAVRYSWSEVAARTAAVYEEVIREARASGWSAQSPGPAGEDWEEVSRRTRVMTRALEPIGRYIPPS